MNTVTQIVSGDTKLCPVRSAVAIVQRIRGYNGTTADTPISAVLINNRITTITSENIINALWDAVVAIEQHQLSITKDQIGTHLIRLGAAMAMYLGECVVFTIMLIGRWSSDVFLRYIRKQVMEFSQNIAQKMLTYQKIVTSQTSTEESHKMILGSKTIQTMPKQEGMLVVKCFAKPVFRLSLFIHRHQTCNPSV
jgi:hypothetical protein